MPADDLDGDGCGRLAAAILKSAFRDAASPDELVRSDARGWLASDGARLLLKLLGAREAWIDDQAGRIGAPIRRPYQRAAEVVNRLLARVTEATTKEVARALANAGLTLPAAHRARKAGLLHVVLARKPDTTGLWRLERG